MLCLVSGWGAEVAAGSSVPLGRESRVHVGFVGNPSFRSLALVLCGGVGGQGFVCLFNTFSLFPGWFQTCVPQGNVVPAPWGWCRTGVTICHLSAGQGANRNLCCCRVTWTRGRTMFPLVKRCCSAPSGDLLVGTFHGRSPKEPTVRSYLRNTSLVVQRFVSNL